MVEENAVNKRSPVKCVDCTQGKQDERVLIGSKLAENWSLLVPEGSNFSISPSLPKLTSLLTIYNSIIVKVFARKYLAKQRDE